MVRAILLAYHKVTGESRGVVATDNFSDHTALYRHVAGSNPFALEPWVATGGQTIDNLGTPLQGWEDWAAQHLNDYEYGEVFIPGDRQFQVSPFGMQVVDLGWEAEAKAWGVQVNPIEGEEDLPPTLDPRLASCPPFDFEQGWDS